MRFTKHNITKGKSANSATTTTTVSNPTVDLSGVYSRMGEDEARIGTLENQVEQLNTTTSGLDNKYLRKDKTDSTEYTLTMGKAKSNYFVSGKYDTTGIGFSLAQEGTVNPDYMLVLSGLGNGCTQISSKSVQLDEQVVNYETIQNQEVTLSCNNFVNLSNTTEGAYALVDAGFTCGNRYTIIEESLYMSYVQDISFLASPSSLVYIELEKQGNYWVLPIISDGRNTHYSLKYVVKYNYTVPSGQSIGQAINLYIQGTNTTTTDFYGGIANKLTATPDYLQLTTNGAGIRITSQGIFRMDAQGNMTQIL